MDTIEPARIGPGAPHAGDRLARLGRTSALAVLVSLGALILFGILGAPKPEPGGETTAPGDVALYLRIVNDVHGGEPYYSAALREQRLGNYPVRPFVAVRLPTLAVAMAALPDDFARRLSIQILAGVTFLAWAWRLKDRWTGRASLGAAVLILGTGITPALVPGAYAMHEVWAGLLIALSLALHGPRRWPVSLAIGLLAVSVRELAAPYLLVMAVLAWREGRRVESAAWLAGIVAFLGGMLLQAAAVQPLLQSSDPSSQGWLGLGGWQFLLALLRWNLVLAMTPGWVAAIVAPLVLLGLLARADPVSDRLALTVLGYGVAFLFVGRPDNSYWGLLIAPLWPLGLVAAWPAVRSLAARVGGGS